MDQITEPNPRLNDGTQVLRRAVDVLRTVARIQWSGASLAAITRATGLSRTTALRIVHFLREEHLLEYSDDTGRYQIGSLAFELGLAVRGGPHLVRNWQPRLENLSRLTGMTAYLVALSGAEVVCLARADTPSIIRAVPLEVGQRLPLGIGAGSLALLSSLTDDQFEAVTTANSASLVAYGAGRITPDELRRRVEATRANGFAFSENSVAHGVCGIGVVVPQGKALVRLALSVSTPRSEFDVERLPEIAQQLKVLAATGDD